MKVTKVVLFGTIPAGTKLWLTEEQARSRAHAITEVGAEKPRGKRKLYAANQQLGFKAGEELAVEGNLDRTLQAMFGIEGEAAADTVEKVETKTTRKPSEDALRKAFEDGEQSGAAELLSDIERSLGLTPVSFEERLAGGGAGKSVVLDALAKAKAEGRAEMMAEVEAYNAAVDELVEAETALEAADEAAKAAATDRVDKAKAALDALPELKA